MKSSQIAKSVLVQAFVRRAIHNMIRKNVSREDRHVVHSDIIPRFSEHVVQRHLAEGPALYHKIESLRKTPLPVAPMRSNVPLQPLPKSPLAAPSVVVEPKPVAPVSLPKASLVSAPVDQSPLPPAPVSDVSPPRVLVPSAAMSSQIASENSSGTFGKITPLLRDPSVFQVECPGSDAPVMVYLHGGQKQVTKITLSADEIKGILETFSEKSHVPLMEGVFRVMVDGLAVNAVISELIGSKFLIKKHAS